MRSARISRGCQLSLNMGASYGIHAKTDRGYIPLGSVWEGEDSDLLERLLSFYPRKRPERILDATMNGGRFWRGSDRPVIGLDIEGKYCPQVAGDNARMPFQDGTFDVVVYDPPHIPNQGKDKQKDFNVRFGLVRKSSKDNGYSFSHTYPPFVAEAHRFMREEGILLCKITDYIHNHRYQWAHVDLIRAASSAGFRPCDCIIKIRKGPIIDPKWKVAHHTRRQHCYWLIFRKSRKCEQDSVFGQDIPGVYEHTSRHLEIPDLTLPVRSIEMDVIEALAFERDISPKALAALASPHRSRLCRSYQPQEVDWDFEELVRYDREFPHCTEHEDDVVPVQMLNNSANQVLGRPRFFLGRA